jgi:hypothetical protein
MKESEEIIQALLKFRNERDWEQFHNPKEFASETGFYNGASTRIVEMMRFKDINSDSKT